MKYFAILALAIFLASYACADIGPSPSYSFSISNADDYPDYEFYYAGQIWPTRLEPANPAVNVYKLNTHITVYAVPKEIDIYQFSEANFDEIVSQSVVSQNINLSSGDTKFKVASFDPNTGTMQLEVESHTPDISYDTDFFLWIAFPLIILIVAGVAVAIFLVKKRQKK